LSENLNYRMPRPYLGEVVYYYVDGDTGRDPVPAIVVAVGAETLNVSVVVKDAMSVQPRDGVRHISDPRLSNPNVKESGSWDWGGQRRALQEMIQASKDREHKKV